MSITTSEMTPADIRACTCGSDCGNGGNGNNGMFGNDWAWIIILLLFGFGGRGFGGGFGGGNGGGYAQPIIIDSGRSSGCGCDCCATPADVRAAVDQQTLISKLDQQTYGLADSTYALNNTINQNFRGVDNAIYTLGYNIQSGFNGVDNAICNLGFDIQGGFNGIQHSIDKCCCDIERGIERGTTQGVMNTNAIQRQISDCCCDIEKATMQSRFDAQAYNCNTLQAIDKLGDRIIDYMANEKLQSLRDENQTLRLAASQSAQNAFITANQEAQTAELIRRLGRDVPVPAYVVPNPNCCYQYNVQAANSCGCGCGNGGF